MKFTDRLRAGAGCTSHIVAADIIDELEAALRDKFCPCPVNRRPQFFDVGPCFDAKECGCSANSVLAKLEALASE